MKLHNFSSKFAPAVLLLLLFVVSASASQITGSLPLVGTSVTQSGADLSVSATVSAASTLTSGPGLTDYSVVPLSTLFGPATLTVATVPSGGGFSLSDATFGTFIATSGVFVTHNASFLDVFLLGTYTPGLPGAGCSVCTPTGTLAHVSINQGGNSLSEAITITSPATSLPGSSPEPATMTLLGSALVGLGLFGRKRFAR